MVHAGAALAGGSENVGAKQQRAFSGAKLSHLAPLECTPELADKGAISC